MSFTKQAGPVSQEMPPMAAEEPHSPSPLVILMPTSQSICLDYGRFKTSPCSLLLPWCTVQPHKHVQPALWGCTHSKGSQEDRSPQKCPGVSWEKHSAAARLQELGLSTGVMLGAVSPSSERKLVRLTAGLELKSE